MKIVIINGPNLNLLGRREPQIYGSRTMADCLNDLRHRYEPRYEIIYFQSNHEGDIIDAIQKYGYDDDCLGVVINAGAYTHTSLAIADAIAAIERPVVEVHISNVMQREPLRHHSMIASACRGVIAGFGLDGYRLAVEALLEM